MQALDGGDEGFEMLPLRQGTAMAPLHSRWLVVAYTRSSPSKFQYSLLKPS